VKRIADSTVRRLSAYLRFLEESAEQGVDTISSDLGYSVAELTASLREILGLEREWKVIIVGAGKIGMALGQYHGFEQRGFRVKAVYDTDPRKVGTRWGSTAVRDMAHVERDIAQECPDIAVLAVPVQEAQPAAERLVKAGVKAILNFAPTQLQVPADVSVRNVNMAMELEGLSFALSNRGR
jgi:redox-sensing transcriptional repressor